MILFFSFVSKTEVEAIVFLAKYTLTIFKFTLYGCYIFIFLKSYFPI